VFSPSSLFFKKKKRKSKKKKEERDGGKHIVKNGGGPLNPMYGCTGALNPMYGKSGDLSPVSIQVNVYSLDNVLVRSFTSQVAAAEWLSVNQSTVSKYIKSGKVFRKQYLIVRSP
jgi:hypothetical protein